MKSAFTFIELLAVIVIIGVLSVVAIPYMKNRRDQPKWSEGRAVIGNIRTAANAYKLEKGSTFDYSDTNLADLGFKITPSAPDGDLDGKYFTDDCFSIKFTSKGDYLITVDAAKSKSGDPPSTPRRITLDSSCKFTETP